MENKKYILITGGSSGIGLALALKLTDKNNHLLLLARDKSKLENARNAIQKKESNCQVDIFCADVSDELQVKEVANQIKLITEKLDTLICNAGVLRCGRFEEHSPQQTKASFDINYWGIHQTIYHFLPFLKNAENAKLAMVSSVAGYTGLFGYSHYAPSKFAIAGLAECLRMEFKDYGITVTVIYPPDTETAMLEYERANTLPECKALSKGAKSITAKKAAEKIIRGMEKGKFEIYFNAESKLIRFLKGNSSKLYYRIVDGIVRKSRKKK